MFAEWREMWRREFTGYRRETFQKDLLAGLTVAAVALPLALAFGVASGADAAAGLVTAILAGLLIGLLGGAPYQISGPTGAMSAILIGLAARHGLQGVWMAGLLAGVFILALGLLRLGRVVALIPAPVISGFTSGIALIIALGQLDNFFGIRTPAAESIVEKLRYYVEYGIAPNGQAVLLALLVMGAMVLWPRFTLGKRLPGSLVGIVLATLVAALARWQVPTIGAVPRTLLLENRLTLTTLPWRDLGMFIVPALSIAALGSIESLLCGAVAGNMTGVRMYNNLELVAQGMGNIVIPFFGGVPATAAIARTSVGVKSGGVTRMVSIIHGLALLGAALLFGGLIGRVPMAALAGVLMVTAWRMNEWSAIRFFFGRRLKHAMLAFTVTLLATVLLDLTQAILIGLAISSLIFMAQMSELQVTRQPVDVERLNAAGHQLAQPLHNASVLYLSGPLFFAAARRLMEQVEASDGPEATLILSMRGVPLIDATGVEVLRELWHRQRQGGGTLLLASLQPRVEALLRRTGFLEELGSERLFWSADRAILAIGATLEPPRLDPAPAEALPADQAITPHSDRAQQA